MYNTSVNVSITFDDQAGPNRVATLEYADPGLGNVCSLSFVIAT